MNNKKHVALHAVEHDDVTSVFVVESMSSRLAQYIISVSASLHWQTSAFSSTFYFHYHGRDFVFYLTLTSSQTFAHCEVSLLHDQQK